MVEPRLLPRVIRYFGLSYLQGVTVFTLVELVNELGISVFGGGRVEPGQLPAPGSVPGRRCLTAPALALRHAVYQELLAAEFLRSPQGRDAALAAALHPRLTEEIREFLHLPQPGHQPARHDRIGRTTASCLPACTWSARVTTCCCAGSNGRSGWTGTP